MEKKEAYQKKREAQLNQLRVTIEGLAAKADKARAEAKVEYAEGIDALKAKQEEVKMKLKALREASGESSKDLKAEVESALFDLKKAVESAVSGFK
jgi:hypothetical protein